MMSNFTVFVWIDFAPLLKSNPGTVTSKLPPPWKNQARRSFGCQVNVSNVSTPKISPCEESRDNQIQPTSCRNS